MKDYIFFDLDGTLTDSQEGILNSLRYTLEFYGVEYSDERLKTFIGPPIVETFKKLGFLGEKAMESVKVYRKYFAQKGIFDTFNLLLFLMISSRQVRPESLSPKPSLQPDHAPNASNLHECFG